MSRLIGRTFLNPWYDYLLIGGGLSLLVIPAVWYLSGGEAMVNFDMLPWFFLLSNSAHFAASTVRLYTKAGTRQSLPFVTMVLPLISVAVLTVCLFAPDSFGRWLQITYLTWSPYHYAAQAYGLAVMYCYRSGCSLTATQKRVMWWIALLPFFKLALTALEKHVLFWVLPPEILWQNSNWQSTMQLAASVVGYAGLILPVVLFAFIRLRRQQPMPLISLMTVLTNAVWFVAFDYLNAFVWATIFHGIQYLAIVTIFHVREQVNRPENQHGRLYHVCWFYGISVVLGYALFNCWPQGYILMGFGAAESLLLVVAVINIHHFIVDGFIWKLQKSDGNRTIVEGGTVV